MSSDANYSSEISDHPFFSYILEYQRDGVKFWEKYGKHHPFLLDQYPFNKTQNGRPFHKNFSKIGLDSSYAKEVSFVELLDIPTIGNKSKNRALFYSYINPTHLKRIDSLCSDGEQRLIFLARGVIKDIMYLKKQFGLFNWLPNKLNSSEKLQLDLYGNRVQEIYHFSSSHIHRELSNFKKIIDSWLETVA